MKAFTITAAALAACAMSAPASAAEIILDPGPNGTFSGEFGDTINMMGDFFSTFTFTLPEAGLTSGTISTVALDAANNIDFQEVLLNGSAFALSGNGTAEFGSLTGLATMAGQQTLTVRGFSGGNGSFAGTISFVPNAMAAVPEPSTWMLLLLGFMATGFAMRRKGPKVRVKYNFA